MKLRVSVIIAIAALLSGAVTQIARADTVCYQDNGRVVCYNTGSQQYNGWSDYNGRGWR